MAVIIRNMDMPNNCVECFIRPKGCASKINLHGRAKDCPLQSADDHIPDSYAKWANNDYGYTWSELE